MVNETIEVPLYINGQDIKSGNTQTMSPPHDHQHILGSYHTAQKTHVESAIATALEARKSWSQLPWEQRAGIFLRAAELIAGQYRAKINASTMIGQLKTVFQANTAFTAICREQSRTGWFHIRSFRWFGHRRHWFVACKLYQR